MQITESRIVERYGEARRYCFQAGLCGADRHLSGLYGEPDTWAFLNPALFTAINKDTAELHHELVPFNASLAQRMSDRAVKVITASEAGELLPRMTNDTP